MRRRAGPPPLRSSAQDAAASVDPARPAALAGGAARAAAADGWDALQLCAAGMLLTVIWRVQEAVPLLGVLQLPSLAFLGAGALLLFDRDPRRGLRRLRHPVVKLVVALSLLLGATVFTSVFAFGSYNFFVRDHMKTLALAAILAASIRSFGDLRRIAGVQVAGAALYACYALVMSRGAAGGRLVEFLYYDQNDTAMLVVATMPLAIFFLSFGRSAWTRLGACAALAVFMLALVKSGSRGGFLGLAALALFFLLSVRAVSAGRRVGVVVAGLVLLTASADSAFWTRMSSILEPSKDYNWVGGAPDGRMEIWKRGIGYMLDRPFLGTGVGAFEHAEGLLSYGARLQQYGLPWRWAAAHNSFVQIGAESGVFGLLLFLVILGSALRTALGVGLGRRGPPVRSAQAAMGQALAAVLVVYCVNGFFLSMAYSALLYATLALTVGLANACPPGHGRPSPPPRAAVRGPRPRGPRRGS